MLAVHNQGKRWICRQPEYDVVLVLDVGKFAPLLRVTVLRLIDQAVERRLPLTGVQADLDHQLSHPALFTVVVGLLRCAFIVVRLNAQHEVLQRGIAR